MTDRKRLRNTSAASQRARILEWLQLSSIDTPTARSELNVMHPAARIQELREAGHPIQTHRRTVEDEHGGKHVVAVYYLATEAGA